jgi:hypothetical protein
MKPGILQKGCEESKTYGRLRIWGSGVRISSDAPIKSDFLDGPPYLRAQSNKAFHYRNKVLCGTLSHFLFLKRREARADFSCSLLPVVVFINLLLAARKEEQPP